MNNISLNRKFITIDFEQAAILDVKLIFFQMSFSFEQMYLYQITIFRISTCIYQQKNQGDRNLVCALTFMSVREIDKL